MGLYTPTILGGNSYLSWFYDRGTIKDPAHTGTSKRLSQAINRGPIKEFLPKYANVHVTIQSHCLSAGAWTHYVTANGVRIGLLATATWDQIDSDMGHGHFLNSTGTRGIVSDRDMRHCHLLKSTCNIRTPPPPSRQGPQEG